jgi:hypothetical protein
MWSRMAEDGQLTVTCLRAHAEQAMQRFESLCDAAGLTLLKSLAGKPLAEVQASLKTSLGAIGMTPKMDAALKTLEMAPFLIQLGTRQVWPHWSDLLKLMPDYLQAASADLSILAETNSPAVDGCKVFMDSYGEAVRHAVDLIQVSTTSLQDLVGRCRSSVASTFHNSYLVFCATVVLAMLLSSSSLLLLWVVVIVAVVLLLVVAVV